MATSSPASPTDTQSQRLMAASALRDTIAGAVDLVEEPLPPSRATVATRYLDLELVSREHSA